MASVLPTALPTALAADDTSASDIDFERRFGGIARLYGPSALAAFRAARVPLVDLSTWPETEENKAWGEAIVCMLLRYAKERPESQAFGHAKLVEKNNYGARLLPEELAAAGQLPLTQLPAPHAALIVPSQVVHAEMHAVCKETGPGIFAKCVDAYRKKRAAIQANASAAAQPPVEG